MNIHNKVKIGSTYGSWTVLKQIDDRYKCACVCGEIRQVNKNNIKYGLSTSCGCTRPSEIDKEFKGEIFNENELYYLKWKYNYIKENSTWKSLRNFIIWALEYGYEEGLTLLYDEKEDFFSPDNCYWGYPEDRVLGNQISYKGKTQNISAWARDLGMSKQAFSQRLSKMSIKDAIEIPVGDTSSRGRKKDDTVHTVGSKRGTLHELCEVFNIKLPTVKARIKKGATVQEAFKMQLYTRGT